VAFVSANDGSITSRDDLISMLDSLPEECNKSTDKIAVDFDNDSRFGYFILN
jgi:hypothetical protein